MHKYIHTYTHIHKTCINIHIYIHTYIHTHTHISTQREVIKQQIGTWPVRKEDLTSKYQNEFSAFVNAIDFGAFTTKWSTDLILNEQ
jgi:hypothetical protein